MTKIKVTIPDSDEYGELKGKVIKLDPADIDFGGAYVLKADLKLTHVPKENVQADIQERLDKQAESLKTSLLEDDAHVRSVLDKMGVPLDTEGKLIEWDGISQEDLAVKLAEQKTIARTEFMSDDHQPVLDENVGLKSQVTKLQRSLLHSEILEAARTAGVKKSKFNSLPEAPRSSKAVIAQTEGQFGYDDKHGHWALKDPDSEDGEGFVHSSTKNVKRPFAGPETYFANLREGDEETAKEWFDDERPDGSPPLNPKDTKGDPPPKEGEYNEAERIKQLRQIRQSY